MVIDLTQYQTLVFDCDGVVLNSNKVKTQAFYNTVLKFGHDKAQEFIDYHVQNGGVSRYIKFEYFIKKILQKSITKPLLDELLNKFSLEVKVGLMQCEIAVGLKELRKKTPCSKWLIVSGGDQNELREVFVERGLFDLFDGGVFGSPDTKDFILKREQESLNIGKPALFLGDSKYDFQAADKVGLDFVFLTKWSEVKNWRLLQKKYNFLVINSIDSLLKN